MRGAARCTAVSASFGQQRSGWRRRVYLRAVVQFVLHCLSASAYFALLCCVIGALGGANCPLPDFANSGGNAQAGGGGARWLPTNARDTAMISGDEGIGFDIGLDFCQFSNCLKKTVQISPHR